MVSKSQKIDEKIHQELKTIAAQEGKSLQEVTEEMLKTEIKARAKAKAKTKDKPE